MILRGQNHENITREIIAKIRIAIWGLRSARIKKLKKTDPHFFSKKIRVCFLQLFDPSTPKASNCDPTAREYFMRNHSYKNSFKQCKISYNLIKFCCIWEFKVSTESRDNILCFCTLSMYVTINSNNKSPFHHFGTEMPSNFKCSTALLMKIASVTCYSARKKLLEI